MSIRQEKINKRHPVRISSEWNLFTDHMIQRILKTTPKLLELINEFSKVADTKPIYNNCVSNGLAMNNPKIKLI